MTNGHHGTDQAIKFSQHLRGTKGIRIGKLESDPLRFTRLGNRHLEVVMRFQQLIKLLEQVVQLLSARGNGFFCFNQPPVRVGIILSRRLPKRFQPIGKTNQTDNRWLTVSTSTAMY